MSDVAAGFTVADLCQRWRIGADKIRAFIRAGELAAINTAMTACARPRFVIPPDAVAAFEADDPPLSRRKRRGENARMRCKIFIPDLKGF